MISIVIPLYNKEQSIAQTLDSVISQEGADFEVVIVDDGSTDHSYTIAKGYADRDSRIHLYQQENGGPGKARNTGVKIAQGDWILFLDADDELLPNALKTYALFINKQPKANMFLMEMLVTDGKNSRIPIEYKEGFIKFPFFAHYMGMLYPCSGSMLFRKTLCDSHPFNESYRRYEDLDRLFRIFRKCRIFTIKEIGGKFHTDYSAASHARKDISEDFMGHLNLHGKGFWERMSLYSLFLGEREYYRAQCKQLYPNLYQRYDLLLLHVLFNKMNKKEIVKMIIRKLIY